MTEGHALNTHAYALGAPASSLGRVFLFCFFPLIHLRVMKGGGKRERERDGKGLLGRRRLAADQSSIASSWSAKSSNMLPMSSKMETVDFLLERELEVRQQRKRAWLLMRKT